MLQGTYDDLFKNATQQSQSLLRTDQTDKDRENFNKIKSYYDSCMNEESINRLGPTPIYPEIARLITKLGYQEEFYDTKFTTDNLLRFTDTIIHLLTEGVGNTLFSYGVGPDDQVPEEVSVTINQPSLGLPSREYYEQPEMLEKYRNGLINIVTAILGEPSSDSPTANIRREKLTEQKLTMLGKVDAEAMVERFVQFETHLAKLTVPK
jgi:predicted metalloendopeptidase